MNILITGASSGIGAATAQHLARAGATVFAGVEHLADARPALTANSERLRLIELDVTSETSIRTAMDDVRRQLGGAGLHGLVNNAGIAFAGPLEGLPIADLRRQFDVNVVGQIAVTQAALPLIRLASGRIVFVSSIGGVLASQFAGAYHASKFALEAVGDTLRQELDPEGIPVILVEPSVISTPIWEKAVAYLDALVDDGSPRLAPYRDRLRTFRDRLRSADEHGKPPEDVAQVIAEALGAKRPDTRYVVGGAGKLVTALGPLLPDRVADKLAERTTSS
jgi:NAD(P)-dependent dehydrogenase (short-subunit alcohol dehydrogenase family)